MLKKILNKFRKAIRSIHEKRHSPSVSYSSDLYIVEFPKSGITWFSTALAGLYWAKDSKSKMPTHFSLEQIVGDVHQNKDIPLPLTYPYHRTIKSHDRFNSRYRNVVYLIRNPFSVMKSFYLFSRSRGEYSGSFDEFVKDSTFGIKSWVAHVESWLKPEKEPNFQLVRYEDILERPKDTLENLFLSLGFVFTGEELQMAIDISSFDIMKKDNYRYKTNCPFREYDFVREGAAKTEISKEVFDFIKSEAKGIIEEIYPEYL